MQGTGWLILFAVAYVAIYGIVWVSELETVEPLLATSVALVVIACGLLALRKILGVQYDTDGIPNSVKRQKEGRDGGDEVTGPDGEPLLLGRAVSAPSERAVATADANRNRRHRTAAEQMRESAPTTQEEPAQAAQEKPSAFQRTLAAFAKKPAAATEAQNSEPSYPVLSQTGAGNHLRLRLDGTEYITPLWGRNPGAAMTDLLAYADQYRATVKRPPTVGR